MVRLCAMRNYQLVLVLKPSLSDAQRKKVLDGVKDALKEVKVAKEEEWGQKQLAYNIKKEAAGFYLNLMLEAKSAFPLDFEKKLMTNEDVLRHLLLRKN